jgi:hypothetical protein
VRGERKPQADLVRPLRMLTQKEGERLAFFEEQCGYDPLDCLKFLEELEFALSQSHLRLDLLPKVWETKKLLGDPAVNAKLAVDRFLLSW